MEELLRVDKIFEESRILKHSDLHVVKQTTSPEKEPNFRGGFVTGQVGWAVRYRNPITISNCRGVVSSALRLVDQNLEVQSVAPS